MNVLSKIVIPKTNVTMGYINNELEEYAREEFFRLKKVLEIKRKMYESIQDPKAKKKKEGAEEDGLCIACKEEMSEQKTEKSPIAKIDKPPEPKPALEPESVSSQENKLNYEEIDKLIIQLNEIVNVTTDMDEKGLLKASVDDFLKTAQVLKSKLGQKSEEQNEELDGVQSLPCNTILPDDINMDQLCDTCKEKYSKSNDNGTQTDPIPNEEEKENALDEKEFEGKAKSPSLHDSDAELATFETEFKEITKITKTINEDGSVTIKKKVIKIEREIRTPVRSKPSSSRTSANKSNIPGQSANSSSHSNPYLGSRTVGLVTLKNLTPKDNLLSLYRVQRVKSEILNTFSPMSVPTERFCLSSTTILSLDIDLDYPMDDINYNLSSSTRNNVRSSDDEA
ncbi:unnamed protein product, partial [Brenthis ino]